MPFKRKRSMRSRVRRVRRRIRKGVRRYPRRGLSSNVHYYKRYGVPSTVTLTGTTESDNSDVFKLDNVQAAAELTALYDQYKISCVVMKFQLLNNPETIYPPGQNPGTTTNNPTFYPKIWYTRDYDDNNTLTLAQMREVGKAKCKVLRPNSMISVKIKPACASQIYRTAVTTGYSPVWPKKLDCTNSDIPHYGLKWVIDTNNVTPWNNGQFIVRVEYLYYLKMFNTR